MLSEEKPELIKHFLKKKENDCDRRSGVITEHRAISKPGVPLDVA